ncbi:MAG: serine/threonine protein kinase [Polyangiaceae bacterium]|nr:serine/threonine protein kinase [Polyangiaceae bacterium]
MKSCPKCQRTFPNDSGFCPEDGTNLIATSLVPVGPSDDPRVGRRLCGRYEIRRVVADGGMGRVYEGVDKQNDSRVAVKVLHKEIARDEVSLERFKREAEMSQRLAHEHIVQVLDFQHDPERQEWMLVMEFLDGEELRVILKREKTLSIPRLLRMLSHAAKGLTAAHAIPIVHRDLKPDNLFLCGRREGDITKILDFGSVKDKTKDAKKLTVMGTTIGSPYYMAPEQAQGLDTLDSRADVFAIAAIAYECIVGSVPFPGSNGPSILLAILTKDHVPPTTALAGKPTCPPARVDDVFEEGLAKNQNIRTKTIGGFVDALGQAYGFEGDHLSWSTMTIQAMEEEFEKAKVRAANPAPVAAAVADPFAAPPPGPAMYGGPMGGGATPQMQPGHAQTREAERAMDQAFNQVNAAAIEEQQIAGLPSSGPPAWLLPAIATAVILFALLGYLVFA